MISRSKGQFIGKLSVFDFFLFFSFFFFLHDKKKASTAVVEKEKKGRPIPRLSASGQCVVKSTSSQHSPLFFNFGKGRRTIVAFDAFDEGNKLAYTTDGDKRVVFGDLLLHLGCDLWFSFCTRTITCGTKTEP